MALGADERQQAEYDRLLTGPLTFRSATVAVVDPETGLLPPSWWDGDEDATASSMAVRAGR